MHFREDGFVDNFAQFDGKRRILTVAGSARVRSSGDRLLVLDAATGLQRIATDLTRLFMPGKYPPIYDGKIVDVSPSTLTLRGTSGFGSKETEFVLTRLE